MQLLQSVSTGLLLASSCLSSLAAARSVPAAKNIAARQSTDKIAPKVFIVSMVAHPHLSP